MRNSGVPTILKWANNKNNNKLTNGSGKNGDKSKSLFGFKNPGILKEKLIFFQVPTKIGFIAQKHYSMVMSFI